MLLLSSIFFTFPAILILRFLRPLILIRFGSIRSDAIGNSIFSLNYYLCKKEKDNINSIDLFYFENNKFPNSQWRLMAKRKIKIHYFFYYFERMNNLLPGGKEHRIKLYYDDYDGLLYNSNLQFEFTDEEERNGEKYLQKVGLNFKDSFVCLIIRDSSYKNKYEPGKDWSYHNYRNTNIDNYKMASLELARRGYSVIRMGKEVAQKFEVDSPYVIDYSNSNMRSDFLDIWLMAKCSFCMTTGTGIDMVANIFKRPALYINFIPIASITNFASSITVPKKMTWKSQENTPLSLFEMLHHNYNRSEDYDKAGIYFKELSPEEITDAAIEMADHIEGNFIDNDESIKLQENFWDKFKSSNYYNLNPYFFVPGIRIGNAFLEKNKSWFLK